MAERSHPPRDPGPLEVAADRPDLASGRRIDWRRIHLWEIQPVRDMLILLAIFGLLYLGYRLRVVTVPMLIALALAYLFEPVVRRMTRARWMSRQGAAAVIIAVLGVVIVVPATLGAGYAIVQGAGLAQRLAQNVILLNRSLQSPASEEFRAQLPNDAWRYVRDQIIEWDERAAAVEPPPPPPPPAVEAETAPPEEGGLEETHGAPDEAAPPEAGAPVARAQPQGTFVRRAVDWVAAAARTQSEALGARALATGADALGFAVRAVASVGMVLFMGFLTAFFFFFFSTGYGRVLEFWEGLIPERRRGRAVELVQKMDRVIAGFVRGRLTICVVQMVFFTIAYWIIGVPAPLIIGPVVGLLSIVPYVALVGIPLTIVLMWLEPASGGFRSEWWWIVGAPTAAYFLGQALDDYVLTPMIQGRSTGMDTPTILFASLAGGVLAGVYGLLLAIPVAACIKILMGEVFWPRFREWTRGRAADPLPIGRSSPP